MSASEPIIDVTPVASTQGSPKNTAAASTTENAANKNSGTNPGAFRTPSYGRKAAQPKEAGFHRTPPVVQATVIGDARAAAAAKKPSRASGAVQLVAGSAIALVGVPMLILPGPGLLAIGGGVALAASGLKKLVGK
ncbi:MAG: hypothetical protein VB027_06050 [Gordonibacter sp.]|nr:hypothetical protein [Gordonibacter sp.]